MGLFSFARKKPMPPARITCGIYREPASVVRLSGSAVIQDNGVLQRGMSGSNGNYLFTEVGAGVKPIVLMGLKSELMVWLDQRKTRGIENRIGELPEIYMSVQPYRPGARFKGLFPLHDTIQQLTEGIAAFAPGSELTDVVGGIKDIAGAHDFVKSGPKYFHESKIPKVNYAGVLYVKFHYLRCNEMYRVGSNLVSFGDIKAVLETML